MELDFFPLNSIISPLVLNPSGRGGHSLFRMCSSRSFCQGFRGDFIRKILCLWEVELVASLLCLKYIVGFVGIDHSISPAILPAESAKLSSIILWP
jgi:hypothetical protein